MTQELAKSKRNKRNSQAAAPYSKSVPRRLKRRPLRKRPL